MRLKKMQICINGIKRKTGQIYFRVSRTYIFFEFIVESSERILKTNTEMQKKNIQVFQEFIHKGI